jgi:hypothetical protein
MLMALGRCSGKCATVFSKNNKNNDREFIVEQPLPFYPSKLTVFFFWLGSQKAAWYSWYSLISCSMSDLCHRTTPELARAITGGAEVLGLEKSRMFTLCIQWIGISIGKDWT